MISRLYFTTHYFLSSADEWVDQDGSRVSSPVRKRRRRGTVYAAVFVIE